MLDLETSLNMFLIVCPLVFLAGVVDSIAGGGGLISLPAYLIAGVPPHLALGTNKLSSAVGTVVSTVRYCRNMPIRPLLALLSIAFALIGSVCGSNLALLADEGLLRNLMIFVLPVVAGVVLSNKRAPAAEESPYSTARLAASMSGIAFVIGGYDGFYGPGTGTFLLLLFMGLCKLGVRQSSAYTKVVNLSSNLAALTVFLLSGKVVVPLGLCAAAFSIAGHYIGAGIVLKRGYRAVRPVVLVVLALLFIKLVLG